MLAGNDPRLGPVATNSARLVDCVRVSESVEGHGNTAPHARTRGVNLNAIGTLGLKVQEVWPVGGSSLAWVTGDLLKSDRGYNQRGTRDRSAGLSSHTGLLSDGVLR